MMKMTHTVPIGLLALIALPSPSLAQVRVASPTVSTAFAFGPVSHATVLSVDPAITDPDDSLYRAAREALNRDEYRSAARMFRELRDKYPRSRFVADTYYWEAFARRRLGGTEQLREARDLLRQQGTKYPQASTRDDAAALATQIDGDLARLGDSRAARDVAERAQDTQGCGDIEVKKAAINAYMQGNRERAVPVLKIVLARRDVCSVELRKAALFVVSQMGGDEAADVLLNTVATDPDKDIRGNAIFWLSQVKTDRAVPLLDSILRSSADYEIKEKALFALSQHKDARASAAIKQILRDQNAPMELRKNAVFWLGQRHDAEATPYLKEFFRQTTDKELRSQVLFAVAQTHDPADGAWLVGVAKDRSQGIEVRKNALFWAGQSGVEVKELLDLYTTTIDHEMKEQLLFVYSQSKSPAALDKLFEIAKTEKDKDLRENAIFWIGQSHDPRVTKFLEDLITN